MYLLQLRPKAPEPPISFRTEATTTTSTPATSYYYNVGETSNNFNNNYNNNNGSILISMLKCEDEDIGGPNCRKYTGPIAVYRFSFAMVLFFSILSLTTLGVSTSTSFRARIHNG